MFIVFIFNEQKLLLLWAGSVKIVSHFDVIRSLLKIDKVLGKKVLLPLKNFKKIVLLKVAFINYDYYSNVILYTYGFHWSKKENHPELNSLIWIWERMSIDF